MTWMPLGRRKRGQLKKSWNEGMKKVMQVRNFGEEQCQDGSMWRRMLKIEHRTVLPDYIYVIYKPFTYM